MGRKDLHRHPRTLHESGSQLLVLRSPSVLICRDWGAMATSQVYVSMYGYTCIVLRSNLVSLVESIVLLSQTGQRDVPSSNQDSTSLTTSCCVASQATTCVIRVLGWINDDIVSFCANVLSMRNDYAEDMLE